MAPSVKDLKSPINNKDLIDFLEANHNIMIFGDSDAKKPVRSLVNEFGVEFDSVGYELRDYTADSITGDNILYSRNFFEPFKTSSKGIFTTNSDKPIAFTGGVGQVVDSNN